MRKSRTLRLDEQLVEQGICHSLKEAQAATMAGRVVVNGVRAWKPGLPVRQDATVAVWKSPLRFASRGGYKLEKALRDFGVSVTNRVVLDAGAASGGFTDCLLQHGASMVYAVDVGFGQMKSSLAQDPRVVNWERVNISDLTLGRFEAPLDLCVVDLSYLSLARAVPILRSLFCQPYEMICLIKPLFEGLNSDEKTNLERIQGVLEHLFETLHDQGHQVADVTTSPILGTRESIEFLILVHPAGPLNSPSTLAKRAIEHAIKDPPRILE
jgi:23S rRNA (cytidine1920-2'-O)/16S rRNA (cytidine1409-2'-O)-methyltransferase